MGSVWLVCWFQGFIVECLDLVLYWELGRTSLGVFFVRCPILLCIISALVFLVCVDSLLTSVVDVCRQIWETGNGKQFWRGPCCLVHFASPLGSCFPKLLFLPGLVIQIVRSD